MQPDEPPVGPHPTTGSGPVGSPSDTVPVRNSATAVLALAFGIASIPFAACCGLLGLASGIGAIVLGVLAVRSTDEASRPRRGLAIAGTVCGAAGLVLTIFFFLRPDGTGLPS